MLNFGRCAAVFDMDGTLIDSMPVWRVLNKEFLEKRSLPVPEHMRVDMDTYTTRYCAETFIREYNLPMTVDDFAAANEQIMRTRYASIPTKVGVPEYLSALKKAGVRMIVATNTEKDIAKNALASKDILKYFEDILTPGMVGISKSNPEFWNVLAQHMMISPDDMAVYEDTPAMMRSARCAGAKVVAVSEPVWRKQTDEILSLCDIYVNDFRDLLA